MKDEALRIALKDFVVWVDMCNVDVFLFDEFLDKPPIEMILLVYLDALPSCCN